MQAKNRRAERQITAVKSALKGQHINITKTVDLTNYEKQDKSLEGTGSLVLDRTHNIAFASLSPRTNPVVLEQFASKMRYTPLTFHSYETNGAPIYHTNVMMSIGSHFAIISADSITNPIERANILTALNRAGKDIIKITPQQMGQMAGNIIELSSIDGNPKIIMSKTAYNAFTPDQCQKLESYGDLIVINISTIEKLGGSSARCMLSEIFH